MSHSKFVNVFSPERRRSPERTLSPDLEQAIVKDFEEEVKAKKYAELKEAVASFSSKLSQFFAHFKLSSNEKWYESNPYLRNVPPSLDLRIIVGLPKSGDYQATQSDFLSTVNSVAQLQRILGEIDQKYGHLTEPDQLVDLSLRATLLVEIAHKYARFFYEQVRDASNRLVLLEELKSLEEKLFAVQFPKYLQTLALEYKLNPSPVKKQQLKEGLATFFDHFDELNGKYRRLQQDMYQSYSSYCDYGQEVLPSELELRNDQSQYFRKSSFAPIRKAVRDLMTRIKDEFDSFHTCQERVPGDTYLRNTESFNDKLEDHLIEILEKIKGLEVESVQRASTSPELPSMDSLNVVDECIISYQEILTRQQQELQSCLTKHRFCFEDDSISKADLPSSELFIDSLFLLENSAKITYDQLQATEAVVQQYLSNNGSLNKDFKTISKLLDTISTLKQTWSEANACCQKSRMLLSAFEKKNNVNAAAQRSVLEKCSLPKIPSDCGKNPVKYGTWKFEWNSLIASVTDSGQQMRLLRQSLESHSFATSVVKFCKNITQAFEKLDQEFAQKSSLGIRIAKEVHSIPLAQDSLIQESKNIRKFKDLVSQLEFHGLNPSEQLGSAAILHVSNSLTEPRECQYLSRRTELQHESKLTLDEQFEDFMQFLESLLRNNSTVLQSRSLRNALTEGQGNPPGKVGSAKSRELPKKSSEPQKLNHQNNKFSGPKKSAKVPHANKKNGKENKVCLFCNSHSHNQFARCPEILSRLTDQPSLLRELERKRLCCSCLHSLDNGPNSTHDCKHSFTVKDKDGKTVTKSALCQKFCRTSGNKRLHQRICEHAKSQYVDGLRALQNKMMNFRPSRVHHQDDEASTVPLATASVGESNVVVDDPIGQLIGGDASLSGQEMLHQSGTEVNLGNGKVILANTNLAKNTAALDDDDNPGHYINGCRVGGCVRMCEKLTLKNDVKSRQEGALYDGGSTNSVSNEDVADLATHSWQLPERFDLITASQSQDMMLTRDQFRTKENLEFQTIRLERGPDEVEYVLLDVPMKFQRKYKMSPQYSVQVSGFSLVLGQDLAQVFPRICEVCPDSGFGVFQSSISGEFLPFTTGIPREYCGKEDTPSRQSVSL